MNDILLNGGKICENVESDVEFDEFIDKWEAAIKHHMFQAEVMKVMQSCLDKLKAKRSAKKQDAMTTAKKQREEYLHNMYGDIQFPGLPS